MSEAACDFHHDRRELVAKLGMV